MNESTSKSRVKLTILEMAVFSMLGALMYASKVLMELLPNIHLIGVFIVAETVVYRSKALYPIYIFVFLTGIFNGFGMWWIPYLYIWAVLWGAAMLIPEKKLSEKPKVFAVVCMVVCALHGLLYGTLYAPAQALLFHLDFRGMVTWIIAGLPYDAIHGAGNLVAGVLIVPLIKLLRQSEKFIRQ